ncbi:MAG: nucleotidyltransferase domain-containing protein [Candidatus Bathyarchaeia archaeon]|nr:nucleotidyltransferase domain-containing protein [Candidatus Bathyarchaeota archaeon]
MEVLRRRRKLAERAVEAASEWVAGLPFKVTAILIGSYARGDFNLWSDVDILLLSDNFKGGPVDRLSILDVPPGFQVIPLTLKEFEKLLKKRNPVAVEALNSGIILKDDFKLGEETPPS